MRRSSRRGCRRRMATTRRCSPSGTSGGTAWQTVSTMIERTPISAPSFKYLRIENGTLIFTYRVIRGPNRTCKRKELPEDECPVSGIRARPQWAKARTAQSPSSYPGNVATRAPEPAELTLPRVSAVSKRMSRRQASPRLRGHTSTSHVGQTTVALIQRPRPTMRCRVA